MAGVIKLTFRVEHDCPLARLSRAADSAIDVWSGHQFELVSFKGGRRAWTQFLALATEHLDPVAALPTDEGGMVVWHPHVQPEASISRIIERHHLMWLQPLRVESGWEHYDALSFGGGEQAALDALRAEHPTQVVRREQLRNDEVAAALFMSLQPALHAPTDKQAEALIAAADAGYYRSPRAATTAQVAARLGIGRSAFEERLRGGENRIMGQVLPALNWQRGG